MIAQHLPREKYDVVMLDTLALMGANPKISPELRARAQRLLQRAGQPETLARRDQELPESFQEQIRNAAASAAPATEAITAAGGGTRIDVAFLALHGPYGEDGTLQGMLDLIGIPYVGSGTLASALAMDKAMAKKVLRAEGIPVPEGIVVQRGEFRRDRERVAARAAAAAMPAVVKPASQGSSIGMTMVKEPEGMGPALEEAFEFDSVALVEERLEGTELTVGIIGNRDLQALPVVEIVSKREFFDYRAKYDPGLSEEIVPARISDDVARAAQEISLRAHRALGCRNLSRVDLMLTRRGPVVLEVNTMPGMTVNSLLPKAAQAAGIPFAELLDRLVQLALEPDE
jgi:D-alanine-D-alanine ligase